MKSASRYGDCLLTVATGELAELKGEEEERIGLVRTHAYAVLQVSRTQGLSIAAGPALPQPSLPQLALPQPSPQLSLRVCAALPCAGA